MKNSSKLIADCLDSILKAGIQSIIVVDGLSSDNSIEIASKFSTLIYSDEGRGLGYARQLGAMKCQTPYVLIMSPDDILEKFCVRDLLYLFEENSVLAGILAQKKMLETNNFWSRGQNSLYTQLQQSKLRVIGNPSLYRTELLTKFSFDSRFNANEDTDLCERWNQSGFEVKLAPAFFTVFENLDLDHASVKSRYIWYGNGDYSFFKKWIKIDMLVAMRHLLHPLINYLIRYTLNQLFKREYVGALYTFYAGVLRYRGFFLALFSDLRRVV